MMGLQAREHPVLVFSCTPESTFRLLIQPFIEFQLRLGANTGPLDSFTSVVICMYIHNSAARAQYVHYATFICRCLQILVVECWAGIRRYGSFLVGRS